MWPAGYNYFTLLLCKKEDTILQYYLSQPIRCSINVTFSVVSSRDSFALSIAVRQFDDESSPDK